MSSKTKGARMTKEFILIEPAFFQQILQESDQLGGEFKAKEKIIHIRKNHNITPLTLLRK